jgi:hypothetical protein
MQLISKVILSLWLMNHHDEKRIANGGREKNTAISDLENNEWTVAHRSKFDPACRTRRRVRKWPKERQRIGRASTSKADHEWSVSGAPENDRRSNIPQSRGSENGCSWMPAKERVLFLPQRVFLNSCQGRTNLPSPLGLWTIYRHCSWTLHRNVSSHREYCF